VSCSGKRLKPAILYRNRRPFEKLVGGSIIGTFGSEEVQTGSQPGIAAQVFDNPLSWFGLLFGLRGGIQWVLDTREAGMPRDQQHSCQSCGCADHEQGKNTQDRFG